MKKCYEEPQIEVRKYNIVENKHILTGVSTTDPTDHNGDLFDDDEY